MILYLDKGKITNTAAWDKYLKDKDGIYQVELKTRNQRSKNQNDYFHGCICELVRDALRDAGFIEVKTKADAKTVLKSLFLASKHTLGEVTITTVKDTSDLTKEEFSQFIQDIQIWAADYLGLVVPDPNFQTSIL